MLIDGLMPGQFEDLQTFKHITHKQWLLTESFLFCYKTDMKIYNARGKSIVLGLLWYYN